MAHPVPADPAPVTAAADVSLEDFAASSEAVTIHGDALPELKTEGKCVSVEIALGKRDASGEWSAWQILWSKSSQLTLRRGAEQVVLPSANMRLHLEATHSDVFESPDGAPEPVVAWMKSNPGPAEVAEFCLVEGRPYYVALAQESYYLPPDGPDGEPQRRVNHVLHISDKPLVDGKPPGALTPQSQSWSY